MDKPVVLRQGEYDEAALQQFKHQHHIWRTADIYKEQLGELFEIRHPGRAPDPEARESFVKQHDQPLSGSWAYYPWSGVLLHCVGETELFELRTNRNRNLISLEEQQKLAASTVAVAGMSVGSGIALACVYSGIADTIKIADFDTLETANLNRLRESLSEVGTAKAELAARRIYELNPFADVRTFGALAADSLDDFFQRPDTAVVIDEIDDFQMKVRLRLKARELGVPVLMFTSLGDNILVDVERYDVDRQLPVFNGAIGDVADTILSNSAISPEDTKRYAVQLVGQEYVPTKAMESLLHMGTELVGRPQLYGTIAVDGGLAAYVVRSIILGAPLHSGRYFVKFSELVGLPAQDLQDGVERQAILRKLFPE